MPTMITVMAVTGLVTRFSSVSFAQTHTAPGRGPVGYGFKGSKSWVMTSLCGWLGKEMEREREKYS